MKLAPFTTSYGRKISTGVLMSLMTDIRMGKDYQDSITNHLRDILPEHDDDLDEASEVYNHAETLLEDLAAESRDY